MIGHRVFRVLADRGEWATLGERRGISGDDRRRLILDDFAYWCDRQQLRIADSLEAAMVRVRAARFGYLAGDRRDADTVVLRGAADPASGRVRAA